MHRSTNVTAVMMMSPSTGGRSSRKGINEVKDSLSSTFKSIGTGSAKVGAASSGGPDAQMLELKQSLRKSGKLLRTKLGVKYLYSTPPTTVSPREYCRTIRSQVCYRSWRL